MGRRDGGRNPPRRSWEEQDKTLPRRLNGEGRTLDAGGSSVFKGGGGEVRSSSMGQSEIWGGSKFTWVVQNSFKTPTSIPPICSPWHLFFANLVRMNFRGVPPPLPFARGWAGAGGGTRRRRQRRWTRGPCRPRISAPCSSPPPWPAPLGGCWSEV